MNDSFLISMIVIHFLGIDQILLHNIAYIFFRCQSFSEKSVMKNLFLLYSITTNRRK